MAIAIKAIGMWISGITGALRKRQNEYDSYDSKDNNVENDANFGDGRRYESTIGGLRLGTGNAKDAED